MSLPARSHLMVVVLLFFAPSLSGQTGPRTASTSAPTAAYVGGKPLTLETGTDNGFLECVAKVLGPNSRHGSTAQAFQNLASQPNKADTAVISGHGNSGLICTGDGDHCSAAGTVAGYFNEQSWKPYAQGISAGFAAVRFLGCEVGADQEGADFLFAMAKAVQRPVSGPTSFVWCGNGRVWLDRQARWQEATPTTKPAPIQKPTVIVPETKVYKLKIAGKMTLIAASSAKLTSFKNTTFTSEGGMILREANVAAGVEMMKLIDFANPFQPGGVPAAMTTAAFRLQLSVDGRPVVKEFVVYNDELVQDSDEKDVFYRADSRLGQQLRNLRR